MLGGGIFLFCIICIICSVFTFAGCTKNNVTDVDDAPDPQLAALKQSAIEQIDDNKLIKIKEKYQLFVSDVVYRYDLERNMLYFSMYADTLAESAKEKVRAATEEQGSIAPLRDLIRRLTSGETITAAASRPADSE